MTTLKGRQALTPRHLKSSPKIQPKLVSFFVIHVGTDRHFLENIFNMDNHMERLELAENSKQPEKWKETKVFGRCGEVFSVDH